MQKVSPEYRVNHRKSNHTTASAPIAGGQQALTIPKRAYSLAYCSQTEHSPATVIRSLKCNSIWQGISSEIYTGLKQSTEPAHRIYTSTHSCTAAERLILSPTLLCTSYAGMHTIKHTNCCTETDGSLNSAVESQGAVHHTADINYCKANDDSQHFTIPSPMGLHTI